MASGIFISYRRDDTRQAAGRLADGLVKRFGEERIFRDVDRIELGVDFEQALNQALNNCEVMLVLIGTRWKDIAGPDGGRRLDDTKDWIRIEIVTALRRNIRIVPVLVDGAKLPVHAELPEDLRPLLNRQAFEIDDQRWHSDVERLAAALDKSKSGGKGRSKLVMGAAGAVAVVLGWPLFGGGGSGSAGDAVPVQQVAAADAATPAATAASDITGYWHNADNSEQYKFAQQGGDINVDYIWVDTAKGAGKGTMAGDVLTYTVMLKPAKESATEMACKLILAQSGDFTGNCRWKDQDYPQLLRRRP